MRIRGDIIAFLSAVVVICLYIVTGGPAVYWLDSPEFVASAWSLGVAHPPGHPLAALLGRLFCYLPVGTIPFRVTLASAVQAGVAAGFLFGISRELTRRTCSDRVLGWFSPLIATLCGACSYAIWFQAVRAEVYALHLMLVLGTVYLLMLWQKSGQRGFALAAGFMVGLALCNHHLLVLLAIPGGLFLLRRHGVRLTPRLFGGVALAALLGLCVLVYLPLRSRQEPLVNWGAPHTLERFAWVVSAKAFQKKSADRAAKLGTTQGGMSAIWAVLGGPPTETTPILSGAIIALMGLAGLYFGVRRRESRSAAAPLLLIIATNMLTPMIVGFDPYNPDAHGYLAVAVTLLMPGIAVFLQALLQIGAVSTASINAANTTRLRPRYGVAAIVGLFATALVTLQLVANFSRNDLSKNWAADDMGRALLDQPPQTLLVTSYFQSIFELWSLQTTADYRPDIEIIHRNFLAQPGYVQNLTHREPFAYQLARHWQKSHGIDKNSIIHAAKTRPVAMEYDLNFPAELLPHLRPAGPTLRFNSRTRLDPRAQPRQRGTLAQHYTRISAIDRLMVSTIQNDLETRRSLTWMHYLLARFACARGLNDIAKLHIRSALSLAPQSVHLTQIAAHCGGS